MVTVVMVEEQMKMLTEQRKTAQTRLVHAMTSSDFGEDKPPVELVFEELCLRVGETEILKNISGEVRPGEILAVMGPSGSGKTTLLNILSGRLKSDSGCVFFNGEHQHKRHKRDICYVLQQDVFFPDLSLEQTLLYTALLRLPDAMPYKEKTRHVQKLIDLLDLTRCQHTIIGDTMNRGLSGGEKKRASIASELLTNPALMLLDEPTSGLDSSSATSIISTLRDFAKKGNKSVIVTVHQPSSQIFYMFDRILLLADGQAAYYGSADDVVHHFSQLGYQMALHYNPADFMMELVKGSTEAKQRLIADVANRKEQGHRLSSHRDGSLEGLREVEETLVPRKHSLPWLPPSAGTDFDPGFDGSLPATPPGDGPLHSDVRCFDVCPKKVLEQVAPDAKELPVLEETTGNGRSSSPSTLVKIDRDEPDSGRASWTEECGSHTSGSSSVLSHHSPHHFTRRRSSRLKRQMTKWPTSFWTQLKVLSKRNFIQARSTMLSKVNWVQTLGLAIIAGLIWFQVDRTEHRLSDIQGWMFFSTTYWMLFALFQALASFPSEQEVIHKERASGAYRLSSYYLAKTLGELPLTVCLPLVYHVISYPMMGLHSPSTFFILLGVLILSTIVAQSIGLFISASCMDLQVAIAIAALYTLATQLFAGYLVTSIPTWLEWGRYCSIVHYAYESMQIIEFASGPPVLCSQTHSRFPVCEEGGLTIPAEDIINEKHSSLPLGINILILTGFLITFRLLAYAVLRYRKPRTS